MPDDYSELVPHLPIPNRTVKRFRADDSAATSVKVGHRQALIPHSPVFSSNTGLLLWGFGVMEAFWVSVAAVAIGEVGDKTQLLAFLLAARFRRPLPIIAGILSATLLNHGLAGILGHWLTTQLSPEVLRWGLGLSFLGIAWWTLKPDELDESDVSLGQWGVFTLTLMSFFMAEMGDKTQVATVALALKFHDLVAVVGGTTIGMLLADVPAVLLAKKLSPDFPFHWVRWGAAAFFAVMAALVLMKVA